MHTLKLFLIPCFLLPLNKTMQDFIGISMSQQERKFPSPCPANSDMKSNLSPLSPGRIEIGKAREGGTLLPLEAHKNPTKASNNGRRNAKSRCVSDLVSNSSQAENIFLFSSSFSPLSLPATFPPAVRNNLWDDKARILNNQSHFLLSSSFFPLISNVLCGCRRFSAAFAAS